MSVLYVKKGSDIKVVFQITQNLANDSNLENDNSTTVADARILKQLSH